MSYSFSVRAATKQAAKRAVTSKMAEVVVAQPSHASDAPVAVKAAHMFIDALEERSTPTDIQVTVNGYISFLHDVLNPTNPGVSSGSLQVQVGYL